jgi:hypothetical protein
LRAAHDDYYLNCFIAFCILLCFPIFHLGFCSIQCSCPFYQVIFAFSSKHQVNPIPAS